MIAATLLRQSFLSYTKLSRISCHERFENDVFGFPS